MESQVFKRLAGFGSRKYKITYGCHSDHILPEAFALFAPKLFKSYQSNLQKLFSENQNPDDNIKPLQRNFRNSIFPALTFNFGPQTVCRGHRDYQNKANGFCAITALGDYDPSKGGSIVLSELRKVVIFPPGSTILIPSAAITHGNLPIQPGESRYSFTQYASGSLFSWVQAGCQPKYKVEKKDKLLYDQLHISPKAACEQALQMFSTIESLYLDICQSGLQQGV